MAKHIELKDKELKKLAEGLLEIQSMAFYGYNNNKDNQEQIDEKARELLRFINSKIVDDEKDGFIKSYRMNEEFKNKLNNDFIK